VSEGNKQQDRARDEGSPTGEAAAQDAIGLHKRYLRAQARKLLLMQAKALDAAANTIVITDRDGTMLWVNKAAQQNYGYTLEEIVGKNPRLFSSRRHDRAFYKNLWDTVLAGRVWNDTIFNCTKSGELIQEEMTITPVAGDDGEPSHFIAIKQNVTERKRIEEALHLRQFAIDRISDAVLIARPDGQLVYANDAACSMLSYTADELLTRAVYEVDPTYDAASWPTHFTTLRQARSFTLETQHQTREGTLIPVEATVNYLSYEGKEFYCALVRDLRERKRTENALRLVVEGTAAKTGGAFFRSCARYLAQVLEVRCALVTEALGDDRRIARPLAVWAGDAFLELADYSVEGGPCEQVMLAGETRLYRDGLRELYPDVETLAALGTCSYHGLPLIDQRGVVVGHLAVLDDKPLPDDPGREAILKIFAARAGAELLRQRTEERLREAKEKAVAASEAKSQFLANMSHELRTPLNGVLGYAQILERDAELNDRQLEAIGVIKSSGDHLLGLINDVLDLSKVEAAKIELEPAPFRLDNFLDTIDKAFAPRADEKGIVFRQAIDGDVSDSVIADEKRLRQVLFNLIGNAIKFTDRGEVRFSVQRRGAYTRFEVADTGPGIPPEELDRIFEAFHQAGSRERRVKGTGLGLAISRTLVQLMGSDIGVESVLGQGSSFYIALDLPSAEGGVGRRAERGRRVVGYEGQPKHLLIVDDRPQNRDVLREMLEPLGLSISEASDGRDALEVAARVKPDLVLMDLRMPNMDGLQATRTIRAAVWGEGIPVVAISASAYDLDRQACLAAGCNDFIAKPFQEDDLLQILGRLLSVRWTYEQRERELPAETSAPPLPVAELEQLLALCKQGDILAVRERAEALLSEHGPSNFTAVVLELATQFRMKAIRERVKEQLAQQHAEGER
jgi:PAS domain S-box-containing protein